MQRSRQMRSRRAARRQRALAVLVLMLAQLTLLAFAGPAFAAASRITGTVTSAVTKAPLAGVEVCEYQIEGGSGSACAQTESKGDYVLEVGRAGTFTVHFDTTVEGLIPQTFYKGVFVNREATSVKVEEGATTSGIDAAIEEGGRITGRVLDSSTKAPIQGIEACAELPDVDQSGVEPHRTCATTNAGGEYEIQGLTPGEGVPEGGYEVEFTDALDYIEQFYDGKTESERYSGTRIPIHAGQIVANIDAELDAGGEISGRVTSQVNGQPVAGVRACAGDEAFPSYCADTNAAGEYTITRLPSHEYTVHFGGLETEYLDQYYEEKEWPDVERVSVTAPQKVSGIDASLKAYGGITGTVIDKQTKRPLQGVNVCLASGGCDETNRAGEYSFSKLLAGTYALDFYAGGLNEETGEDYLSQYEAGEYIVQEELKARNPEAGHAEVTMGGRMVIDDELEQGGRISGTMLEVGTEKPASLWPCAEDLSTGHPESAKVCPLSMSGDTYTISGLPPGRYRVVFGASLPAYYFTQYYDDSDLRSEAQEVLVESGQTTGQIDAALIANPGPWEGAIAGTVTDSSSKAAIAGIEACPFYAGTATVAGSCATTGPHGEYLLTGLTNGEYEVEFRSPPGGNLDYLRQRYEPGKAVTVVWGSITPAIDAQLHEGGAISGVAQNAATGQPAGGVSVCAYNALGGSEACAIVGASGSYRLSGLTAGGYTVGFETTHAGGAYFPQYFDEATSASEARSVPVEVGRTTVAVNASLFANPDPGDGAIAGLVADASSSAPLAGIEVCAYDVASKGLFGECTLSTASGRYLLGGLGPGEYELEFSSPQNGDISYLSVRYEEGRLVRVAADSVTAGRDARLVAGGKLTGTVTSASTGRPVQGDGACATDEEQEVEACAPSIADGGYAITGLPAGRYTVAFYGAGIGFANQYYDEADTLATAETIALSSGETVGGIDARLQAGGSIGGLVTSGVTGKPLPHVLVCALGAQEVVVECAVSEDDGEYTIAGIPPGEWRVGFDAGHGYRVQFYDGVSEFSAARAVTVATGAAVTGIDAAMLNPSVEPVSRQPLPPCCRYSRRKNHSPRRRPPGRRRLPARASSPRAPRSFRLRYHSRARRSFCPGGRSRLTSSAARHPAAVLSC